MAERLLLPRRCFWKNPGSWPNVFSDFKVPADYESIGKLDDLLSLLKLFQKAKKNTIPNLPDLEAFFNSLGKKLKKNFAKSLITYFRRGKLQKFFMAKEKKASKELDFISAAKLLES